MRRLANSSSSLTAALSLLEGLVWAPLAIGAMLVWRSRSSGLRTVLVAAALLVLLPTGRGLLTLAVLHGLPTSASLGASPIVPWEFAFTSAIGTLNSLPFPALLVFLATRPAIREALTDATEA